MWENNEFKIRLRENSIYEYEKTMLSSGQCKSFMSMGFIGDCDGETAYYDCSGFSSLSEYRIEKTEDALYLLERTLIIIGNAVEYYLNPSKIMLTTDTVFYNKDTGQIKIAYVPIEDERTTIRRNIAAFITQLKNDITDGKEGYLDVAISCVYHKNYYIRDMITKVALLKRELYAQTGKVRS